MDDDTLQPGLGLCSSTRQMNLEHQRLAHLLPHHIFADATAAVAADSLHTVLKESYRSYGCQTRFLGSSATVGMVVSGMFMRINQHTGQQSILRVSQTGANASANAATAVSTSIP